MKPKPCSCPTQLFVLFFVFCCSGSLYAQYTVSGTVTDEVTGEPIIGTNIFDPASLRGATTDSDGTFSIVLPPGDAELTFTFIGYLSQSIKVTGSTGDEITLNVELKQDIANLEELVVTGLGTSVKRSNLANSITKIDASDIAEKISPQTLDNAFYGKITGVNIISQGGAPGGGFNIQLRGVSTLGNGSSQPLYIIDGVWVNNNSIQTGRSLVNQAGGTSQDDVANRVADLNPDDIESVEVLKGSSAAAIYGQRANAGVIIITTKKGKIGRTEVSVQQDVGFNSALRFLGRTDWNEERIASFYAGNEDRIAAEIDRLNAARTTGRIRDLEREVYGEHGLLRSTSLNVSAGGDKTRLFLSGDFNDEDGIIKNTGFKRQSLRANVDHSITDAIRITSNTNYIYSDSDRGFTGNQNGTGGSLGYTLSFTPNYAFNILVNPDGTFGDNPYFGENPLRLRDEAINSQEVNRFIQSATLNADFAQWGNSSLSLIVNAGFDILNSNSLIYFPEFFQSERDLVNAGDAIHTTVDATQTNLQSIFVFNTKTNVVGGSPVNLTSQFGFSRFSDQQEVETLRGEGLAPDQINVQNAKQQTLSQAFQSVTDVGYFFQQEANWEDKVIGTIGGRLDRSTLNLNQGKLYFFPKASLAVNVANFNFFGIQPVDELKLRAAYGETGGLPNFGATFTPLNSVNIGENLGGVRGTNEVDPGLDPERAREIEFGIDASLFDQRLSLEATYYRKTVEDLILDATPSNSTGIATFFTNGGELENQGVELGLNISPIRTEKINWISRINWWRNVAEITRLDVPEEYNTAFASNALGGVLLQEGVSPTAIGGIDETGSIIQLGDFQPDFQLSFSNDIKMFRNWAVSFMLHWSQGAENIQLSNFLRDSGGNTDDFFIGNSAVIVDRGPFITSQFVEDASYLKLREASVYYSVPIHFLTDLTGNVVRGAKVGVSGNNLFIISAYDGYDPEVSNFGGGQATLQSVSVSPFPSARRVLFHVKLDL